MTGRVVSTKHKNTAVVLVERQAKHPLYKKTFIRSKRYLVDDALGVKVGDIVEVEKCKPISKNKHWKVVLVLGRSLAEIAEEQMKEKAEEVIAEVMPEGKKGEGETGKGEEEITKNKKEDKPKKKGK